MVMIQSILIFSLAALCEVGGGYLIWLWMKDSKSLLFGIFGIIFLGLYGIIATFQHQSFGRVYAAYGGIFIIFSLFWSIVIDNLNPDKWDIIGSIIILIGLIIMMYAPR